MEEEELQEIRNNLLKMREEVLAEADKAYEASQSLGKDGVPDIGDMSSNSYNQEVLMNLSETQRSRVRDIDAALEIGVDYIILDGRGGGTGAAPLIFRDHISVPTIPALARARRHLDTSGASDVTLIATGGLRVHTDFAKAMALGADGVALSNSALQAIGCLGMRACNTNNCPVGIATQKENLRARLIVEEAARRLERFFRASTELMQVMARACGHSHFNEFCLDDLTTFDRDMACLTGVAYGGVTPV